LFKLSSIGIYTNCCAVVVSEKLLKIPVFEPSLIHQLWLIGSHQHPQSGVLLISFSTWGAENGLAEINLESMGVTKDSSIFLGQKLTNTCSIVGGCIIVQQEKTQEQKSFFKIQRTTVLGMFKDKAIILGVIWWSFLTKSATAAMLPLNCKGIVHTKISPTQLVAK
jgi:hypothetical protein